MSVPGMLRSVVVWVLLLGLTVAGAAQAVEAPPAPQTVAGPRSATAVAATAEPAVGDAQPRGVDQQIAGQAQQQTQPTAPVPAAPPVAITTPPKRHHVRRIVVTSLVVGMLVLSGMAGAFHD